jgi:proteasome lid subunit RPN8/RPN11
MTKIKVQTDGGKIRIKLPDEVKAPVVTGPTGAEPLESSKLLTTNNKVLFLPIRFINLMEIRAESGFRPNEEDVEIVYALSGSISNTVDVLHKLSSQTVVEESTEDHVISSVRGMIAHIIKERSGPPKLVVAVHTHPQGVPKPSEKDIRYFKNASETIKALIPGVNILFGIHAISSESIRERLEPTRTSKNTIKWCSITREHEVSFFMPDANPWEVKFND